jgi:hypothetical protein
VVVTDATPYWLQTFDPARDYELVLPGRPANPQRTPLNHGIGITGGRNVIIMGGAIDVASLPTDPEYRVGIKLRDQRGTVHIEGLRIDNASDGINMDERYGAIVQLENLWIRAPRPYAKSFHSDCVQTWAGPAVLRIDHLTCHGTFQGVFLDPDDPKFQGVHPTPAQFDLRNVNVVLTGDAAGYAFQAIARAKRYPIAGTAIYGISPTRKIENGGFRRVTTGLPPTGDFVHASAIGPDYVSPGYA